MVPPSGSFRRYLMTSMINVIVFYILWEVLYWIFPDGAYWPTISWSVAWIIGSFFAHWTHRILTFNSQRDTKWTIPASMGLYTIGWVGSSACYYIGTASWGLDVRLVFLLNSSLWGFLNYIGQREFAFKEK